MNTLDQIKFPVKKELEDFEPFFRKYMKSNTPLLNIITSYIIRRKGKMMRPLFVFLSSKLVGEINKSSFYAASLIELMHTATLVHDDVVDDSHMRRGFFSINALWKNKIAVLVGDYLLAKGLLMAVENREYELLNRVSVAVKEMSEGELLQIEKARNLDITEEVYYEIIRKKTAVLLAACASIGAGATGVSEEIAEYMWKFGEQVGMAFQIKDDIFDFQANGATGKPSGNDLKEKKMTLPLIYALQYAEPSEKRRIIKIVKSKNKTAANVNEVVDFIKKKGGMEYAGKKMNEFKDHAIEMLDRFPDNQAKKSLIALVHYTTTREK